MAFLAHLAQGGRISDRSPRNGRDGAGASFNFDHFRGGPLLWAPSLLASSHLFIGHTACPGFSRVASDYSWWRDTRFCTPGYDYFHDGWNYAHVPVDMAPHAYASVSVSGMEDAAWSEGAQRSILLGSRRAGRRLLSFLPESPVAGIQHASRPANQGLGVRGFLLPIRSAFICENFLTYQIMADRVPDRCSSCRTRSCGSILRRRSLPCSGIWGQPLRSVLDRRSRGLRSPRASGDREQQIGRSPSTGCAQWQSPDGEDIPEEIGSEPPP